MINTAGTIGVSGARLCKFTMANSGGLQNLAIQIRKSCQTLQDICMFTIQDHINQKTRFSTRVAVNQLVIEGKLPQCLEEKICNQVLSLYSDYTQRWGVRVRVVLF